MNVDVNVQTFSAQSFTPMNLVCRSEHVGGHHFTNHCLIHRKTTLLISNRWIVFGGKECPYVQFSLPFIIVSVSHSFLLFLLSTISLFFSLSLSLSIPLSLSQRNLFWNIIFLIFDLGDIPSRFISNRSCRSFPCVPFRPPFTWVIN